MTESRWRGETLEARAAVRREAFLQAAIELLGTRGAAAVAMRAAVREAGLSPRYFYESFEDRDALLVTTLERVAGDLRATVSDAVRAADDSVEARLRALFETVVGEMRRDPRIGRIILREVFAEDVLRARGETILPEFVASLYLEVRAPADPWLDAAAPDAQLQLTGLTGALVLLFLNWLEGRLAVEDDALVDHCVALTTATFAALGG